CLEGAQAGLSWITVLKKREGYRIAFDRFVPEAIVKYDQAKVEALVKNPGIIRHRLKIQSVITNARAYLDIQDEFGSFRDFIWQFVDGQPIHNRWEKTEDVPAKTKESDALSKALKKRGFKFVGSTICYAFMQATGMVNDHLTDCFRYAELKN
ncbi:MAG: DNA-3-methyladenine glycosylase I, partial [Bacteroidota bacterium]